MLFIYISLAFGGALGACARFTLSSWMAKNFPGDISHGTLAVNVIGSFVIGIIFILIHEKTHLPESYKPFLMTGFLGSFTTFSTFSLETLNHLTDGQYWHALIYIVLSLSLCLIACFAGVSIAKLA
jgi:fluoride exporter